MGPVYGPSHPLGHLDDLLVLLLDADQASLQVGVELGLVTGFSPWADLALFLWGKKALVLKDLPHGVGSADPHLATVLQQPEGRASNVDDDHQHLDPCVAKTLDSEDPCLDIVKHVGRAHPLVIHNRPELVCKPDEALRAEHEVQDEVLVIILHQPFWNYQETCRLQGPALCAELAHRLLHCGTRFEAGGWVLPKGLVPEEGHLHLKEEVPLAM
mmetsp:Transcript_21050/g.66528  ORF Transcript_21050/g.66528 Transcript_21050/m.66528 type:complete len:214 (+) Transcript_21050:581-1222(+)